METACLSGGSRSQLHLQIANWVASGQLGLLTVMVIILLCCFIDCISLALKSPYMGSGELSTHVSQLLNESCGLPYGATYLWAGMKVT